MIKRQTGLKKPFYKKWWFWVIVAFFVIGSFGAGGNDAEERADPVIEATASSDVTNEEKHGDAPTGVSTEHLAEAKTETKSNSKNENTAPTSTPKETEKPFEPIAETTAPTRIPEVTEQTYAPTTEPTPQTTLLEVTSQTTTPASEQTETMVWIPTNGGSKYHIHSTCSNMENPEQVTISEAIAMGFTPCKRCY